MVLSLRDGEMQPQDFIQAMNRAAQETETFQDYRLIVHHDTEHVHAHVIAFRDKTLKRKELMAWKDAVERPLQEAEVKRLAEAAPRQLQQNEPQQKQNDELDWDEL